MKSNKWQFTLKSKSLRFTTIETAVPEAEILDICYYSESWKLEDSFSIKGYLIFIITLASRDALMERKENNDIS